VFFGWLLALWVQFIVSGMPSVTHEAHWKEAMPEVLDPPLMDSARSGDKQLGDSKNKQGGTQMCVSAFPANFSGTKILINEPHPDVMGKPVHVLLYGNTTENWAKGARPNAMLIGFDNSTPMDQANFIPTTDFSHVLDDAVEALMPKQRGLVSLSIDDLMVPKGVIQVFEVGIYTVVLASGGASVGDALHRVPTDKRPGLSPTYDFFSQKYASTALCCFNQSAKSEPIMIWWEPSDPNIFRLPGLDEHSGQVPNLNASVDVDHWLITSSHRLQQGVPVTYRDEQKIPADVRKLLPNRVAGRQLTGKFQNGDFGIPAPFVHQGNMTNVLRMPPPRP
jgi:hypothetical protein